ncbi:XRE family transcriptional regulator [Streptomyces radicis]|uniref:XRE family transcriptional regulator n=1 Tax=Streptomyces radicis TaxID=1750517 RepID=A0A3A9W6V0_9ACTN|nr:XRE family transcriptional regulator [Streptomyces radicis]RKN21646.1 XRE family transcriptional regulator [Streptomyces radicis]
MSERNELGAFLRSRRARIRPEDAGFASGAGRRRVPGLRREELAHLAGVSVDYYVRLEQGRNQGVSDAVLDAVATALRLDATERTHLYRLARPAAGDGGGDRGGAGGAGGAGGGPEGRPGVRQLLDAITAPAMLVGHRLDVLAWNRAARGLITDFERLPAPARNLARLHLLDPDIAARYPDRDAMVRYAVGQLRVAAGSFPEDTELWRLVDELSAADADFRRHWAEHTVHVKSHGTKRINHPRLGALTLSYESTHFDASPPRRLLVFTAAPGTPEAAALRRLADDAADDAAGPVEGQDGLTPPSHAR